MSGQQHHWKALDPWGGEWGAVGQAAHQSREQGWGGGSWLPEGNSDAGAESSSPKDRKKNLTFVSILQDRRCFRFVIFINVHRVHNNPVNEIIITSYYAD